MGPLLVGLAWAFAALWPLYAVVSIIPALGLVHAVLFIAVPIYNGTQFSYRLLRVPDAL